MSTAVASFLTSAALVLVGQWEKEIIQEVQDTDQDTTITIATEAQEPMFVALTMLKAVAKEHATIGKGYLTGLKPLNIRQPGEKFGLNNDKYKKMVDMDIIGIQLMIKVQLESVSYWNEFSS